MAEHPEHPKLGAWSWVYREAPGGRKQSTARAGSAMVAAGALRHVGREASPACPCQQGLAWVQKTSKGKEATKRSGQDGESQLSSVIKAKKT